jgi:hypothetical protein
LMPGGARCRRADFRHAVQVVLVVIWPGWRWRVPRETGLLCDAENSEMLGAPDGEQEPLLASRGVAAFGVPSS